jgi:hypothetical protein
VRRLAYVDPGPPDSRSLAAAAKGRSRQRRRPTMLDSFWFTVRSYSSFYVRFLENQWDHMTPIKYVTLLVSIGLTGWILMKNSTKR